MIGSNLILESLTESFMHQSTYLLRDRAASAQNASMKRDMLATLQHQKEVERRAAMTLDLRRKEAAAYSSRIMKSEKERQALHSQVAEAEQNLRSIIASNSHEADWIAIKLAELEKVMEADRQLNIELEATVAKILFAVSDPDEVYLSKAVDEYVAEFYEIHKRAINLKSAINNLDRADKLLSYDRLGAVSQGGSEDLTFSLHFVQIATSLWPNLRKVKLSSAVEKSQKAGANVAERSTIVKQHTEETKAFLQEERERLQIRMNDVYIKLYGLSAKLERVRAHVLYSAVAQYQGGSLNRNVVEQYRMLFPRDLDLLTRAGNLRTILESEKEIGRAVGKFYADVEDGDQDLDSLVGIGLEFSKSPSQTSSTRSPSFSV